jgi:isochorismate synthase EntC
MSKMHFFCSNIDWYHVNLNTFFKNKELNRKKTRWCKSLNDLNLHIEYKSNKQNFANDSFRRFDYEWNESIIVNAIANDVNILIMNRVYVHVYNVEHDSQMNRNDELLTILFSMKKNCQFFSKSKTTNKMNIENVFIRDENFESTVSHAYVNFVIKTRILSTKKLVFAVQTKAFLFDSIQNHSKLKNSTRNSRKRFVFLSKKQKILFRKKQLRKSF